MPPPSFSSQATLIAPSLARGTLALMRDVVQQTQASVGKSASGDVHADALSSIASLLNDAALEIPACDADLLASVDTLLAAEKVNSDLLDVFEATTVPPAAGQSDTLLTAPQYTAWMRILEALAPLLGAECLLRDWWDPLLYPALNTPDLAESCVACARMLVEFIMLATPTSLYDDELLPSVSSDPSPQVPSNGEPPTPATAPLTPLAAGSDALSLGGLQEPVRMRSITRRAALHGNNYFRFTQRVFELYVHASATLPDFAASAEDQEALAHRTGADLSQLGYMSPPAMQARLWKQLDMVIAVYAEHRPTAFFHHLADLMETEDAQAPLLHLLTTFLQHQYMHTYRITSTLLLTKTLHALVDTESSRTMALGAACLIMVLPYVPTWLVRDGGNPIALLFRVYGRAVCWPRALPTAGSVLPMNVDLLFTMIYGLFPCNTIQFLHAPVDHLHALRYPAEDGWENDVDEEAIRSRSIPMLRSHTVHPMLALSGADAELTDTKHWLQQDASDLIADCMSLCLGQRGHTTARAPPRGDRDGWGGGSAGDRVVDAHQQEGRCGAPEPRALAALPGTAILDAHGQAATRSCAGDDPLSAWLVANCMMRSQLTDEHAAMRGGAETVDEPGDARGAGANAAPASPTSRAAPAAAARSDDSYLLLRNEHQFERYIKEQLLLHIGRLHRDRIADAASEAEQQNLYNSVRSLWAQLQASQSRFERQRSEIQATGNRHIQWERELNTKLNTYREERRTWKKQMAELQLKLQQSQDTMQMQTAAMSNMGKHLFELETDMAMARPKLERLEQYGNNVKKCAHSIMSWEEDMSQYNAQSAELDRMRAWWEEMQLAVLGAEARESEQRALVAAQGEELLRLREDLHALRDSNAALGSRLAARPPWAAEPPRHSRASTPTDAAPATPTPHALCRQNRDLELALLDARARIEQLETDQALREREAPAKSPMLAHMSPGTSLFSPATLGAPLWSAAVDDAVPPLSIGSPIQHPIP
ncbi:hypothetical protein MSPP1_003139 [Malassezia sp. CBS 17886]|nr:hypothetical protein MSPP1_003139 [Malassezia sp. CBS 17886]